MSKLPRHIAIIMDGNGRWAEKRRHNRVFGHAKGVERAREITRECAKLGVEALTLYTFSTENWQRPEREVNFLMKLLLRYLKFETKELIENNLRCRAIGFTHMLPKNIQNELQRLQEATKNNTGMYLNIALSYGSRQELTEAARALAVDVAEGKIRPSEITEAHLAAKLFTKESPDPDLLIRTGGDQRISNFLLWQSAYAELYFAEKCWPDFGVEDLHLALASFARRERRFGKV
ncbi:MAG: isoprenyl transferase [Bacteriovoracia bacterium]